MKLAVFGATGGTGKIIVEKALAAGHEVAALARNPASLPAGVTAVQGDATDPAAVEKTLAGAEVVLFAIGSGSMKATTVRRDTARTVAQAMNKLGVRRIIAMSGMAAGDSLDQMPWIVRKLVVPLMLKNLLEDQNRLEQAIKQSGVPEWILLRPAQLVEKPTGAKASLSAAGLATKTGRPDVAQFMLDNLTSTEWVGKAPMLG
jgi:putative NADH-flavin reductase